MTTRSEATGAGELSPQALMARAVEQTGLDDWGEDQCFREPLRLLLEASTASGRLSRAGGQVLRSVVLRHLRNRLHLQAHLRRHAEAADRPLGAPIVVTGLPRTGTTLVHQLLAHDPRHRFLRLWEALHPIPPDDADEEAALVAAADRWLERFHAHAPDFRVLHPLTVAGPEECDRLLLNSFASHHLVDMFDAPAYDRWFYHQPLTGVYREYARQLRVLTHPGETRQWVVKSPTHLPHLDALLDAIPEAVVVHCHRDPVEAVASYASLIATVRRPNTTGLSPPALGDQALERCAAALTRGWHTRHHHAPEQVFDLSYPALAADPLGELRRLYAWLDTPLDRDTETAMRRWLADHPRHQHGIHHYHPHDFGLTADRIRAAFTDYAHHFAPLLTNP